MGLTKNPLHGGGMDIFWNFTMLQCLLFKSLFEKSNFPTIADVAKIFHIGYMYHGEPLTCELGMGGRCQFCWPQQLFCPGGFFFLSVVFSFSPKIRGAHGKSFRICLTGRYFTQG